MIRWLPVRATRLHECPIECGSTTIRSGSLFPFFDGTGSIEHALIVDADSSVLRTVTLTTTTVTIPLWGPIVIDANATRLNEETIEQLAPLWHYDPWWLLRAERFSFTSEVPVLKRTNCAESFETQPSDLCFTRRLTKVGWVIHYSASQGDQVKRFRAEMLPDRQPVRSRREHDQTQTTGWQLKPFWH